MDVKRRQQRVRTVKVRTHVVEQAVLVSHLLVDGDGDLLDLAGAAGWGVIRAAKCIGFR